MNEAPVISINNNYSAYEDTNFSFGLAASDEDGDEFTFSIAGADAELFLLSEDFQVTPIFTLNFEQPQDQDANNDYELIVLAEDINGNVGQLAVNFSVLNRQELGYFTGLAPIVIYEVDASNGESSPLFKSLTWVEPDAQFAGQVLTIWGHLPEDSIVLESDLSAELTVLSQTGQVIYMGEIVAQITPSKKGEAGAPLEITFNEFTTPDAANVILSAISYRNSAILPVESRLIYFELVDQNNKVIRLINSLDMIENDQYQPSFTLTNDSNTHLTDINDDNLVDLVVGQSDGQLAVYINNASAMLDWQSTANGALAQFDVGSDAVPFAADLDNDGDNDLLVGNQSGFLSYFENTTDGGALTFVSKIGRENPGRFIDVGAGARPTLVDADNDLDFDLYITNSDGELFYYENTGSVSNAVFELQNQTLIDLSLVGNVLGLAFADLDTDGDVDLLVGSDSGRLIYYKNLGTVTQPLFKSEGLLNPFN
ncbi:FG-GAP repeat domain-containing protein [Psychrosphaera algicola]|uniref:VCBS repeat-containing protein n=1 Tax=Psychrosphaera algicola TaxID=3023714 RepID=A0ABT5FH14_9GAMM|nr:VCBS repeat-containing protein [Psychrosphaera sp. G1-22]MDC2890436.1 VCBS repeat-containing protein [Psychrosphaera sp. G1-22]